MKKRLFALLLTLIMITPLLPVSTPDTGEKEGGDNDFAVLSPQTGYESNPTPWGVLLILLCCLAIIVFSCLKTRRAFFIMKKSFSDTDK